MPDMGAVNDPRLRRLLAARMREEESDEDGEGDRMDRLKRRRRVIEPEVVEDEEVGGDSILATRYFVES